MIHPHVSVSPQRQVLFIAHSFPPTGGSGVQRSAKLVKYLPEFGWKPIVLTVRQSSRRERDDTLLSDLPSDTVILRTPTFEPVADSGRLHRLLVSSFHTPLSIPDEGNLWLPWALPAALRELRARPVLAVYASGDPFSSHILAAMLKVRTGLPLVLDYRDEWTLDPARLMGQSPHRRLFHLIERSQQRWVVGKADRVLLATDSARNAFRQRYGDLAKFITLRNGYDTDDFERAVEPDLAPGRFHLVYSGSTISPVVKPDTFFEGLRRAVDQSVSLRDSIQVHFVGAMDEVTRGWIDSLNLAAYVKVKGYVSHSQSLGYLCRADALLLVSREFRQSYGSGLSGKVPAKLYEYAGARKPVLALTPRDSEAFSLLQEAGVAVWANPEEPSDIARRLIEVESLWRSGTLKVVPNETVIAAFERKEQTGHLAHILEDITLPGGDSHSDRKTAL
jgi:glycosyltransferase involved in cell wall biosynthesis